MKTILTTITLLFCAALASATVRTCNNNNPSPGQYTDLQVCIDESSAGDTIYVSGSPTSYGSITINVALTIIGTGFNPSKENSLVSKLGNITLSGAWMDNASFSRLIGLDFQRLQAGTDGVTNIEVSDCRIRTGIVQMGEYDGNNSWLIRNCLVSDEVDNLPIVLRDYNHIVRNCIIYGTDFDIELSLSGSVQFENNIFISTEFGSVVPGSPINISLGELSSFKNCIFSGHLQILGGGATLMNNCTTSCMLWCDINCSGCIIQNNLEGVNPQFVNYDGGPFDFSYDFHLQPNSPAHAGDGTQMGVYGGSGHFTMTGEPAIPQIKAFNIPANIGSSGTLQGTGISTSRQ